MIGVVVIGRNEGDRLVRCLRSVAGRAARVVYVDSGSSDDSVRAAGELGADVVRLDTATPFTAARARNEGFRRLREIAPEVTRVQFVDGDCELAAGWLDAASAALDARPDVAVACGRRRERYPERSVYNRLCDLEWDTPVGDAEACGGDALMRADAFEQVGGFRDTLIAGEEPELCARLRTAGWVVARLPAEMTAHDAAMSRFGQWWRRSVRAGHAYAEVASLHGRGALRSWRRQVVSNTFWALGLPLIAVAVAPFVPPLGLGLGLGYPVLAAKVYRTRRRRGESPADARVYAAFCVLSKFAMALGQLQHLTSRLRGRATTLIEYKAAESTQNRLRVAYLVNQYPHVSHSFIRREIHGLEADGVIVSRFTVRRPGVKLVDPSDIAEQTRTRALLDGGLLQLALASLGTAITRPVRWLRAARLAWRFGRRSGKRLRSCIYHAEACRLRRWVADDRADHVHAHFGTNSADVAVLCRVLGGPPVSLTVHGPEEFDRPESLSLGDKVAAAAFVVAVSSFGRSQLYRWSRPDDWPKIHVVRCGVDDEFLAGGPLVPVRSTRLVCVGRLAEQKGQLVLIEAAAMLAARGLDFDVVLAGDGPMRESIERAVAAHGLGPRVRITGWLGGAAVRAEMAECRVVVLPSFAEGLPVVLMEALALGRPVVTTFVAGIPELVRAGQNGWLVPAGDPAALADALADALAAETERLAEMGRVGSEAVRNAHDARREAAKLAVLFRATAARRTEAP